MPYKPSVRLELNDTRFEPWESMSIKQTINALAGISITAPNPAGIYSNLPVEDMPIKVFLGWDTDDPPLFFDGYHDDPAWNVSKRNISLSFTGRDFGRILFDELTVDDAFTSYGNPIGRGYLLHYIQYLASNLSTPINELFERNTTDDDNELFQFEFQYKKVLDEVRKLAQYGNYEWLMTLDQDDNRQWIVRQPKSLTASNVTQAFIVGEKSNYSDIPSQADIQYIESIRVNKQYGFKKNYVKVQGDGVSGVYPLSPPSSPKHLYHEDNSIISSVDALQVSQRLWAEKSAPKTLVDFSGIGVEQLRAGDVVYVNDYRYGASQLPTNIFRIVEINNTISKSAGWKATFKVGDFVPTLFQFIDGTTGL